MKTVDELLLELRCLNVKLWTEGNRLRYRETNETLPPALLAQLRQQEAEIIAILKQADNSSECALENTTSFCSLTYGQQALWFLYQIAPESVAHNIFLLARIDSELDLAAWRRAWQQIVDRHTILRTTYTIRNGQPIQQIHSHQEVDIEVIDVAVESEEDLKTQIYQQTDRPFDLESGPVLRVKLFSKTTLGYIQLILMHHIAGDMWSLELLLEELQILYAAEIQTQSSIPIRVPFPKYQYTDYVRWQNDMLANAQEKLWTYWHNQLAGELPSLNLPSDRPHPKRQSYRGDSAVFKLDAQLIQDLKDLAKNQRASLYIIMLAAFFALVYRYTGQEEIILGTTMAGRSGKKQFDKVIGDFTNTTVLRSYLALNPTFRQLLTQLRPIVIGALKHQEAPFSLLVEQLKVERDRSRSPLVSACFTWHKYRCQTGDNADKKAIKVEILPDLGTQRGAVFDINLKIMEAGNGFHIAWEYSTDLFDAGAIAQMQSHYENLLGEIVANPEQRLGELPLLTASEKHQLLVEWNNTRSEYPQDICIHELFAQQVELTPNAVALVFADQQLTYQQLNQKANQLAHYLQSLGVGIEMLVGICVEPSLLRIIALLGILKAGGVYVPIDSSLEETSVSVLLTQSHLLKTLPAHQAHLICLDTQAEMIAQYSQENPSPLITSTNLAYVMYKSGASGQAKGVSIIHRSVVHLVKGNNYANFTTAEVFLQLAAMNFDGATLEIWGSLLNGGRLVIIPSVTPSTSELAQAIRQHQVTILWLRAELFHLMVDEKLADLKQLKQLLVTESLSVPHVKKLRQAAPELKLINVYSSTENTTVTCCYQVTDISHIDTNIPIGRPIANTQVYLLDAHLQPLPVGIPGEIYIAGDGLARGYFKNPELTAAAFISYVLSSQRKTRLYKTGDRARYLADGNIELIGRIDQQQKTRGYQIQGEEIKTVVSPFVSPRTPTEAVIADIIASILGVEEIGIHDNFFALGGHSLLATQVIFRLRQAYQLELPWRCLFEAPTVAELDKLIASYRQADLGQTLPEIAPISLNESQFPLSFAQARLWLLDQLVGRNATYNMPLAMRIFGNLDINALERSIHEIVQRHASLRTNFQVVQGLTVQVIHPNPTFSLHIVNLQNSPEKETEVQQLVKIETHIPFDLALDSLIRARLFQLSPEEYVFVLTIHHIVCDAWSIEILLQELSSLYPAFCTAQASGASAMGTPLPELPIQYVDYTLWQWQLLTTPILQRQLNYWNRQLAGVKPLLQLPTDKPRQLLHKFKGSSLQSEINPQLKQELKTLSQASGVTMFMILLTAFVTLLYRYSDRQDILIGSAIANRHQNTKYLIGLFANILVLRINIQENLSFNELLTHVKEVVLAAQTHQDVPFEQLVKTLLPSQSLKQSPLVQVLFNLEPAPSKWELPGLTVTPMNTESTAAKFDLTLSIVETTTGLKATWEYNSDLFQRQTIARMSENFHSLLTIMAIAPQQIVGEIPLIAD
ncbi:amino acid adenylation domain-containing protein [Calothrix sp. NIES-2100]|uniref:non-ribosomal peptide synthetase n=1 Tax=Calothrix sp. NIES-2100 TaxID=1954172 RepID=UPI000B615AC4|nr:amino acid adenylation domain-containing protein [Calothrix sp. NIES-2100]